MSYETPQMYRWRDPSWPPNLPSLAVYFMQEPQVNAKATTETGVQTYDNVLIAYVAPMGMPKSNVAHEIERVLPDGTVKMHRENAYKYAEQVKHYKAGTEAEAIGTPLKDLIGMTPATAMNLRARGVATVEMLSDMPDAAGNELMGFWELRDKAKKHLEARAVAAPTVRLESELASRDKTIAALQKQVDDLIASIASQEDKPKRAKAA